MHTAAAVGLAVVLNGHVVLACSVVGEHYLICCKAETCKVWCATRFGDMQHRHEQSQRFSYGHLVRAALLRRVHSSSP